MKTNSEKVKNFRDLSL